MGATRGLRRVRGGSNLAWFVIVAAAFLDSLLGIGVIAAGAAKSADGGELKGRSGAGAGLPPNDGD